MEDLQHHFVDVGDGVRLHAVSAGKGDPVFLLHGFPQTLYEWRHVMPALAKDYHVITRW